MNKPHKKGMMQKRPKNKKNLFQYQYEVLYKPGTYMTDKEITAFTEKIRGTASTSFENIPDYQIFRGTRHELSDKIIAVAWRPDGKIAGFCSTIILKVEDVGDVIHLGLTVIRPEDRGGGMTHLLTHKAVTAHLFRYRPIIGKVWVSNAPRY